MTERRLPFVDKSITSYLKITYDIPYLLEQIRDAPSADRALGRIEGIQTVIDRLQAIQRENEGD